jgi:FHA domain
MSFRLFIYYCALCGGGGGFAGWVMGHWLSGATPLLDIGLKTLVFGMSVALGLCLVDALCNLSQRQVSPVLQRGTAAVLVGGVGGFFGGLLSQVLAHVAPPLGAGLGWAVAGALIGMAPAVFDLMMAASGGQNMGGPARKLLNGLLGGAAGGFVGGMLAILLRTVWFGVFDSKPPERLWSPGAISFVVLGASIALMVALAQVFLKEAWLRVEAGPRAGREVILTKPVITLGRSQTCDIGLSSDDGVERIHARLTRQGDAYVLTDAGSASGTYVNGERVVGPRPLRTGDAIRVGDYLLRFGERRRR